MSCGWRNDFYLRVKQDLDLDVEKQLPGACKNWAGRWVVICSRCFLASLELIWVERLWKVACWRTVSRHLEVTPVQLVDVPTINNNQQHQRYDGEGGVSDSGQKLPLLET